MLRKINRLFQDWTRPKRLAFGKYVWDRKKNKNDKIDMSKVNKILFLRYDGKIGDMIINTLMFREIKKSYPEIEIGVVVRGANKQVIENNPNVDKIYEYDKNSKNLKKLAGKIEEENYDLLIDFSEMLRVKQMMFINLCKAKVNIGLDKKEWKLFDISIDPEKDFKWTEHITTRYAAYLKKLGISAKDLSYDIFINSEEEKEGRDLKIKIGENNKLIVINPYGASKHKTFSREKIKEMVDFFSEKKENYVTFVFPPNKKSEILEIINEFKNEKIFINENIKTIRDTSGIIKYSDLLITPDTSVVHIGAALGQSMIAIYPPNGGRFGVDHLVWGPSNIDKNAQIVFCEDKKSSYDEVDINTFKMSDTKKLFEHIILL
jgi:ADP-heptose:LPS heptosyltransferase